MGAGHHEFAHDFDHRLARHPARCAWPNRVLQRLGGQRAHQRLPAMGRKRVAARLWCEAAARQDQRRGRCGQACARRKASRPQRHRRHGGPGLDQWRKLCRHETRWLVVCALCVNLAQLSVGGHRGQAHHTGGFFGAHRRAGIALGHGAAHVFCRRQTPAPTAAKHG